VRNDKGQALPAWPLSFVEESVMAILSNPSLDNHLLQAALRYATRGWRVLPLHGIVDGKCTCGKADCDSQGKHPRTRHGLKDATIDQDTIKGWWATWPSANVGIATGSESGFFMVGPDGQTGIDALANLERQLGPLPLTPRVRSGGGGQHYYFAWPAEGGVKNGANHHGLPIDVRGAGGFVVAPPSLHVKGSYTWEIEPDTVAVAEAPAWLLDWIREGKCTNKRRKLGARTADPQASGINSFNSFNSSAKDGKVTFTVQPDHDPTARAVAYLANCPPAISGQGGHDQTFEVARAVVYGFDLGPEAGFGLLQQHYNPRCQPPWSDGDLRHKCEDADTKPFDKARGYLLNEGEHLGDTCTPILDTSAADDIEKLPMPAPAPWPTLPSEALHGLAGEIVQTLAPVTESDPVAILGQLLVTVGNAAGRGPHFKVEGDSHHTNLFLCLVGQSSRGRKGTSRGRVMQLMSFADDSWCQKCTASGMSSGEGLIAAVRDPVEKKEPIKEKGRITGYQTVIVDEGVADKRLLVDESEFAQVLKVLQRDGNSLSPVIRQSWDTGNLRTLTKNTPLRATGAHISISAHITRAELIKLLSNTEALNGFANRYLWLCVKRSQLLPDGGRALDLSPFGTRLNYALAAARSTGVMTRGPEASRLWHEVYPQLTAERTGLYGAVTGRAEAQVLRLSMIYALFDSSPIIQVEHLQAALALWSYAETSARVIFGAEPEDPLVSVMLAKLQEAGPTGMTRTDIHDAFNRNFPATKLLEALAKLRDRKEAYSETLRTGKPGAPTERWFALRRNELTKESQTESQPGNCFVNSLVRKESPGRSQNGEEVVTL
jgi:hypothetical protein